MLYLKIIINFYKKEKQVGNKAQDTHICIGK